jgi:DNA-binding transcriptional MerR regulator
LDKSPEAFRTISEVAQALDIPKHVLRFWEGKFPQLKPMKRGGGRRYYRPEDVNLLRGIRHLLYSDGYTIRGVQKILREHGARFVMEASTRINDVEEEGLPEREIPDIAAEAARMGDFTRRDREKGGEGDDVLTILDELETCRQILAQAKE